jgi:hypothetical protein
MPKGCLRIYKVWGNICISSERLMVEELSSGTVEFMRQMCGTSVKHLKAGEWDRLRVILGGWVTADDIPFDRSPEDTTNA